MNRQNEMDRAMLQANQKIGDELHRLNDNIRTLTGVLEDAFFEILATEQYRNDSLNELVSKTLNPLPVEVLEK